jgi:hypothetical protein
MEPYSSELLQVLELQYNLGKRSMKNIQIFSLKPLPLSINYLKTVRINGETYESQQIGTVPVLYLSTY